MKEYKDKTLISEWIAKQLLKPIKYMYYNWTWFRMMLTEDEHARRRDKNE